jgi:hypothetical protein
VATIHYAPAVSSAWCPDASFAADGQVLISCAGTTDLHFLRLTQDGDVDQGFGNQGIVSVAQSDQGDGVSFEAYAIQGLPGGGFVTAGANRDASHRISISSMPLAHVRLRLPITAC